ncbi:hypothetical protein F5Y14DRAFT_407424 [Nemania sp. NC0429]|nr:hypothetical protein F5Y14DRAFT_407424 [Nemania sp. NC0429]
MLLLFLVWFMTVSARAYHTVRYSYQAWRYLKYLLHDEVLRRHLSYGETPTAQAAKLHSTVPDLVVGWHVWGNVWSLLRSNLSPCHRALVNSDWHKWAPATETG